MNNKKQWLVTAALVLLAIVVGRQIGSAKSFKDGQYSGKIEGCQKLADALFGANGIPTECYINDFGNLMITVDDEGDHEL